MAGRIALRRRGGKQIPCGNDNQNGKNGKQIPFGNDNQKNKGPSALAFLSVIPTGNLLLLLLLLFFLSFP